MSSWGEYCQDRDFAKIRQLEGALEDAAEDILYERGGDDWMHPDKVQELVQYYLDMNEDEE